ncbi:MAG TPA: radical SAM protein, partial [Candidatus Edwardsbacteria bacterium]|nr:radical SAM protein [Candidatus Edwardsbacteria bacterium]
YQGVPQVREGRCMQRQGAWASLWPPLSLAMTAAVLRRAGHEVRLIDAIAAALPQQTVVGQAVAFSPDWCIVNTATPSIPGDVETAAALKQAVPACRIALIGIHVTALPGETLQLSPAIDAVIRGEPEMAALDLASGMPLPQVAGISYRGEQGSAHNPDRPPVAELDMLPFPAWDLIDKRRYLLPLSPTPFLLVATGRGCPHGCAFCADHAYYGRRPRRFSPGRIVDEIAHDVAAYGVDQFLFWAESFTLDRGHALAVAEEILRRGLKIGWVCNSRSDQVDPELLAALRRAGCWMIGYGLESGVDRVLGLMGKGSTVDQARQAVRWAHQAGLQVTGHLMLGFPGETRADLRRTAAFARELGLDYAQFYAAVPFPGSALYDQARRSGWLASGDWRRYEQNYGVLRAGELTPRTVEAARRAAYRAFYLRPSQLLRTAARLRSRAAWRQALRALASFGEWAG